MASQKNEKKKMSIKQWIAALDEELMMTQQIDDYERYENDMYDLIMDEVRLVVTRKHPTPIELGLDPKTLTKEDGISYAPCINLRKGTKCEAVIESFWIQDFIDNVNESFESYLKDSKNNYSMWINVLVYIPKKGYTCVSNLFFYDMRDELKEFVEKFVDKDFDLENFNPEKLIGKKALLTWNGRYFDI